MTPLTARTMVEAGCDAALIAGILAIPSIRAYVASTPRPHRCLFAAFFIALLIGQAVNAPRLTFPFTSWAMYGRPEHPGTLVFYRVRGFDESGQPVDVEPEKLFSSVGKSSVASKLKELARKPSSAGLEAFLRAVGAAHNRRHSERPIRSLTLVQCSLSISDRGASGVREEPIREIDLGVGGRS